MKLDLRRARFPLHQSWKPAEKSIVERLKALLNKWIDSKPGLRERANKSVFRLKLATGVALSLFLAWHGFLFYLDRPAERAIQIEIAKAAEIVSAPEVFLGDAQQPVKTTAGAKPQLPTATSTPVLPADVAAVTAVPVAAVKASPSPIAKPSTAVTTSQPARPTETKLLAHHSTKISVQNKAKFPKGVNNKKVLEFFKKKLEYDNECFKQATGGTGQLTALIKTAPNGSVLAVTLRPVANKDKRKIASVVKEWTPTAVCLKKHLDKAPLLKSKGKKPSVSELILKIEK